MSWDAPYPEWPLPQRKDLLYQLLAQDADTFGGDAVQQNDALANFIAPTVPDFNVRPPIVERDPFNPNSGIATEEPFNLAELFKSEAEPAPTVPEIDPRSPGNQFIEEAKQPATDVVAPFLQPETLLQLPADLKAPEAKEEEPAQNESAKYDYNEKNWPSIIPGSTDEDGRFLTKTTTTDGTPFYLRDDDGGGMYQNPATVETFERVTSPDGQTYYKVHAPVFSSGKEAYETPVTSVVSEAQYKAIKGPGSIQSVLNSPIGSFALNLLGPYGQIINAANAANQGNVAGAVLSGLNAAGGFGMTDIAGMPIKDITNTINFAKAAESKDPLAILMSGANLGGVTDVGGVKLQDISKGIGTVKALESGNPNAIMNAIISYASKASSPNTSGVDKETIGNFDDNEVTRLQNLGYTKDQIKDYFGRLEGLTGAFDDPVETLPVDYTPPSTRSLGGTQVDDTDDFLKSIGINTIDDSKDSGLSNQDIEDIINGGNEMVVTGEKDKAPASSPIDDYFKTIAKPTDDELVMTANRAPKDFDIDEINPNLPSVIPGFDDDELVMTGTRGVQTPASSPIDDYFKTIAKPNDDELVMTANRSYPLDPTIPDYIAPPDITDEGEITVVGDRPVKEPATETSTPPSASSGTAAPKSGTAKAPAKAPATAQPTQQAQNNSQLLALLAMMDSNNGLANIKSYKELFDTDLYKPGMTQEEVQKEAQKQTQEEAQNDENTSDNEEDFFNGGHVNDITVDDLLQILRG